MEYVYLLPQLVHFCALNLVSFLQPPQEGFDVGYFDVRGFGFAVRQPSRLRLSSAVIRSFAAINSL